MTQDDHKMARYGMTAQDGTRSHETARDSTKSAAPPDRFFSAVHFFGVRRERLWRSLPMRGLPRWTSFFHGAFLFPIPVIGPKSLAAGEGPGPPNQ